MRLMSLFLESFLLSLILMPLPLLADKPQVKLSPDFQFQGKPIEPACVFELILGDGMVDLANHPCQKYSAQYEQNDRTEVEGSFGYYLPDGGFPWDEFPERGYIYYKYLGRFPSQNLDGQNSHLLLCHYNTGGTGQFGSLEVAKLQDDKLQHVSTIDSGDRSEGRITEAAIKDGILNYKKQLTFADLYGFTPIEGASFIDTPRCCICDAGTAVFAGEDLVKVEFDEIVLKHMNTDVCYVKCLVENTLEKGKFIFTVDELDAFNKKAYEKCKDIDKILFDE